MLDTVTRRLVGALVSGDLPETDGARGPDRHDDGGAAVVAAAMQARARVSGLVIGLVAVVVFPAWSLLDFYLEPRLAQEFLVVRLLTDVPMLGGLYLLWRSSLGRRRPELLTLAILAPVQLAVCWMVAHVDNTESYASGLLLAIYGVGGILAAPVRWTVVLVILTWVGLGAAVLLSPVGVPDYDVAAVVFWLATATVVATLTHSVRHTLGSRELSTKVHLLRERERTRLLLDRLERLSLEDPLTGLANRRRWDAELTATCAEADAGGHPVAVVVIDVDHFKQVNDRHGHAGGDMALREVARLLVRRVRAGDIVARLGGDELAVLMPGSDADRATELAEALRVAVAALVPPGFDRGELTLSLGVAAGSGLTPAELMSRADERLYAAKATRNAVGRPLPHPRAPHPVADAARSPAGVRHPRLAVEAVPEGVTVAFPTRGHRAPPGTTRTGTEEAAMTDPDVDHPDVDHPDVDHPDVDHPAVDSAADVTSVGRGLSVDARIETADASAIVVRPSVGDFVGQDVVAVGEEVEVFWHAPSGGRALRAVVTRVEYGAVPRWYLSVTGPAVDRQRRIAVRCRVGLPVTVTLRGVDLAGESRDLSEAGVRVVVEGFGAAPDPGTALGVTVDLEDGATWYCGEVVRAQTRGPDWVMSLRFVDPTERDQDRLRRRVFQGLREERARSTAD